MIMEMGKLSARVGAKAFVTKHSAVFLKNVTAINTFQLSDNSIYSVNLKC